MRKDSEAAARVDRRNFLKGTGLAIGAVGAAVVPGSNAIAKTDAPQGHAGYRETEHVRTYYELARF
jgi:hypothetical protein